MKQIMLSLIVAISLFGFPATASANACSNGARQLAASMNAVVISVQSSTDGAGQLVCVATLKINSPGQPPRVVTRTFRP